MCEYLSTGKQQEQEEAILMYPRYPSNSEHSITPAVPLSAKTQKRTAVSSEHPKPFPTANTMQPVPLPVLQTH
jgi:hypothetical protein